MKTATCQHGVAWFRDDCPMCGRDPETEERRGREALRQVFEDRLRRMEEWHARMQRMLAECLEGQ